MWVRLVILRDNGTWFDHWVPDSELAHWQGVYGRLGWQPVVTEELVAA